MGESHWFQGLSVKHGSRRIVMSDLRDIVFDNLNNAQANGYSLDLFTPEELASDMIACADLGDSTTEQVLPHVLEWLEVRRIMGRVM
jgi:hypothetical protein